MDGPGQVRGGAAHLDGPARRSRFQVLRALELALGRLGQRASIESGHLHIYSVVYWNITNCTYSPLSNCRVYTFLSFSAYVYGGGYPFLTQDSKACVYVVYVIDKGISLCVSSLLCFLDMFSSVFEGCLEELCGRLHKDRFYGCSPGGQHGTHAWRPKVSGGVFICSGEEGL